MVERALSMWEVAGSMPASSKLYSLVLNKNIFKFSRLFFKKYINFKRDFTFKFSYIFLKFIFKENCRSI